MQSHRPLGLEVHHVDALEQLRPNRRDGLRFQAFGVDLEHVDSAFSGQHVVEHVVDRQAADLIVSGVEAPTAP